MHRIAGTLDPKHPLALTPTAVDGPPVVTGRGVVLGGNGRTMGLRLAYERGEADAYRRELVERAPAFGLERAAVERMRAPVLVRVVHDLDAASSAELADASARYNEGPGNAMDERARAVSLSRRLSPATLERVAELLELHETLRAAMAAEGRAFVRVLEADGIVTAQNRAAYVTDAGELTEAGKQLLEGAFLGLVAGTPERLSQAAPATLAKLERITPAVARVAARANGHDLVPDVQAALDVLHRAAAQRVTVLELAHQADAFDAPPPARVLELAQDLELLTQKRLAAAARAWAAVADYDPRQPLMFGEHPTPAEAWGRWRSELERKAA